jgi:hypothetical protein
MFHFGVLIAKKALHDLPAGKLCGFQLAKKA